MIAVTDNFVVMVQKEARFEVEQALDSEQDGLHGDRRCVQAAGAWGGTAGTEQMRDEEEMRADVNWQMVTVRSSRTFFPA